MNNFFLKDRRYIPVYIFTGVLLLLFFYFASFSKNSTTLDNVEQYNGVSVTENISNVQYRVEHMHDITPESSWKTYHSEFLGVTFNYPPDMLVREYRNGDGIVGMLSGSIELYPDTPEARETLQEKNPDAGLPPGMFFARSVPYEQAPTIETVAQTRYFTEHGYGLSDIMGMPGIVTAHQGINSVDSIVFVKDFYLYEAFVEYVEPDDTRRDEFYTVVSSFVFDEK
jgi:hypothetical protein